LPITFPRSVADLPDFKNYSMQRRTYRYLDKAPLYPFGYGLSYTRFAYRDLAVSQVRVPVGQSLRIFATVENVGGRAGDEVVQLYLKDLEASCVVPHHSLRGTQRVHLAPGEARTLTFELQPRDMALVDDRGRRVLEPGRFRVFIGGSQPDERSRELTGESPLAFEFEVIGEAREIK
jgi:beta-glucosidase